MGELNFSRVTTLKSAFVGDIYTKGVNTEDTYVKSICIRDICAGDTCIKDICVRVNFRSTCIGCIYAGISGFRNTYSVKDMCV